MRFTSSEITGSETVVAVDRFAGSDDDTGDDDEEDEEDEDDGAGQHCKRRYRSVSACNGRPVTTTKELLPRLVRGAGHGFNTAFVPV